MCGDKSQYIPQDATVWRIIPLYFPNVNPQKAEKQQLFVACNERARSRRKHARAKDVWRI
jgi:hypothetical protein